ncbi:MAG: lipase family protein [Candidatus Hydrogenedentales bacterium]|jgi:pimeloyl-ACP methyl ester carboxylesterase
MKNIPLSLALLAMTLAGCARTVDIRTDLTPETCVPGTVHKVERVGCYSAVTLRAMLWISDLPGKVTIKHGVRLYRVEYWTTNYDGQPTVASGLVALPKKAAPDAVVECLHGTTTLRNATPSKPTLLEGVSVSAIFAGAGYLLVMPDYIGYGTSHEMHPYLHAKTTADTSIDLLKAAHAFSGTLGVTWPTSLYLTGYSQGGHATAATQRALEAMNDPRFQVVASAPSSGTYNLADLIFPFALEGKSSAHSLYLAFMVRAYSAIYQQPIESVIKEEYAVLLPVLYDGEHDGGPIMEALPRNPRDMFQKTFLDDYDNGRPTWLLTALRENETYQWTPKAPMHVYYGESDTDVSPKESIEAAAEWTKRGANVQLINLGDFNHEGAIFQSVPLIRKWFDEVRAQQKAGEKAAQGLKTLRPAYAAR